jgi:hypothetical protein
MAEPAETDESSLITAAHLIWDSLNPAGQEKSPGRRKAAIENFI